MKRSHDPVRRVVVTGMGSETPLGHGVEASWEALLGGRSGVSAIRSFDTADHAVKIAAQVPGNGAESLDLGDLSAKEARRVDLGVLFAIAAAREALADSGLAIDDSNRDRIGTAIGSGIGGLGTLLSNHRMLIEKGPRRVSPFTIPMSITNMPAGYVSIQHGLQGPNLCHVSACASGSHSIGESARLIARGEADAMLAGGCEAPIHDLGIAGFSSMRALSTRNDEPDRSSRPFDRDRDGFVVGEGAGVLVLETLEGARARGATILAEVAGYGATADAAHMAAPEASGEGIVRCMRLALQDAELAPEDVDHVNAHATSTPAGDPIEALALRSVFGPHADRVPVSATKSMTGHLLGAAGAIEAIFAIRALGTGMLPPTINLDHPDPECSLDHVVGKPRQHPIRTVLSNSFGFGGTNSALVFRSAPE